MFTKQHFEAIAGTVQRARRALDIESVSALTVAEYSERVEGLNALTLALADTFERDNAQFKRDRFLTACIPGNNVRART